MKTPLRTASALAAALALSACSSLLPPTKVDAPAAAQWYAPLPHDGTVVSLAQWWQQQGDPLLVELITAAEAVSPSVSQSLSRIAQARANQATARSALLPQVNAQLGASRGVSQPDYPVITTQTLGLQAGWELDLVGANRAVSKAAQAQVESNQAQWHDARVLVAAEVANLYYSLSTCQQLLDVAKADSSSRQETARLSEINAKVGFVAPSVAALARASAADANSRVTQQSAQCDINTKGLVALTAIPEPQLKEKLAATRMQPAQAASFSVASVPAQVISQRPDVFSAERDVMVASAQVGSAIAQRLPRLSLSGSIGAMRINTAGVEQSGSTWSFGPLALSLPIFDAGQRAAAVESARAAYQTAVVAYQGKVRQAVREVEEALVTLQSTEARRADATVATQGYAESLAATQTRYGQGLANLVELEDARRSALAAQTAQLNLQLERNRAWVALYRALGGGWTAPDATSTGGQTAPQS
ncbi:efflux transporter outer membrane subunit [Rhodoferax saidenbachensis]|uniref:RND transporter n=1 Tax=Rhodoferax saidenbachensis TaxID=1484693 RepID=A0A1P8KBD0_9BURK|nr:efflux transporter outer membrane subunit [Rhodoferax saidenbachensis]APW43320.1 RND transporter [Rhodoferax saidenbachensis]